MTFHALHLCNLKKERAAISRFKSLALHLFGPHLLLFLELIVLPFSFKRNEKEKKEKKVKSKREKKATKTDQLRKRIQM